MNLKEFSKELGLSPTTVSRALNGYPEVSKSTRERVELAAQQFGYVPNTRAKRLAMGRAMTIGHLLPLSKEHELVNPIFSDFLAGAGERYTESGFDLQLSVVRDENEENTYREIARRGDVDGFVIHGPKLDDPRIRLLSELGLPFVVHGRSSSIDFDYNWVDVNNRRSFQRATDFLLDLGHERIALVNGIREMDFAARRETGFLDALKNRNIGVDPSFISSAEMTEPYGYETVRRLMEQPNPPTAFLISSIIPAIGARRALGDLSLVPGRDVSLVIHDDDLSYFRNHGDVPTYTSMRSSVRVAGYQAANTLLQQIEDPKSYARSILLEAELIVGKSTGPAGRSSALISDSMVGT